MRTPLGNFGPPLGATLGPLWPPLGPLGTPLGNFGPPLGPLVIFEIFVIFVIGAILYKTPARVKIISFSKEGTNSICL